MIHSLLIPKKKIIILNQEKEAVDRTPSTGELTASKNMD